MSVRKICTVELEYRYGVSEEELQRHGLAGEDAWPDGSCFSLNNNRLVLLDGIEVVAAVVTHKDFVQACPPLGALNGVSAPHEIVALEVLPQFRRRGIATAIVSHLASDRGISVLAPNEAMEAVMRKMEPLYGVSDPDGCMEAADAAYRARMRP